MPVLFHGICIGDEYGIYADAEAKKLVTHIIITEVEAVHAVAKYTSATRSEADGFQVKVGYHAILSRLARPPAYVKLVSGADDQRRQHQHRVRIEASDAMQCYISIDFV